MYICCDLIFEEGNFPRTTSPHSFKHSQVQFSFKKQKDKCKKDKIKYEKKTERIKETSQEKKRIPEEEIKFHILIHKINEKCHKQLMNDDYKKIRVDVQEIKQTISFHHVR